MGLGLKPQKSTKRFQEALFSWLQANKIAAPEATVDLFGRFQKGSSRETQRPPLSILAEPLPKGPDTFFLDSLVICDHC